LSRESMTFFVTDGHQACPILFPKQIHWEFLQSTSGPSGIWLHVLSTCPRAHPRAGPKSFLSRFLIWGPDGHSPPVAQKSLLFSHPPFMLARQ
jgi:hypothetical protein